MASNKVWVVKFVAGNPRIYSVVRSSEALKRGEAIARAKSIDDRWRVWVEHVSSGQRIFESSAEVEFRSKPLEIDC
jgi:hypothetical protein